MAWGRISTVQEKDRIIVNGYATEEITREQLARWANNLTFVSYYSYGYTRDGDLIPICDGNLIQSAYDSGVAPLMVLTPLDENGTYSYELVRVLFTNPASRDRLVNQIVATVAVKGYYGVVFNFGHIEYQDREQFVAVVSETSARLNLRGNVVIVSLISGINDAGFDYMSLGRAANFIELRAFYWDQAYGPPSAVSPIARIRGMIAHMITMIDSRRILLGMTNYGFDWILPAVPGAVARIITHEEAEGLAERFGIPVQYSEAVEAPFFMYRDPAGSHHEVWFENVRSVRAKLNLVNEFHLAGISIWTIMNPFPAAFIGIREMFTVRKV